MQQAEVCKHVWWEYVGLEWSVDHTGWTLKGIIALQSHHLRLRWGLNVGQPGRPAGAHTWNAHTYTHRLEWSWSPTQPLRTQDPCASPSQRGLTGPTPMACVCPAAPTFSPLMKRSFSLRFTCSMERPCSPRDSKATVPSGLDTTRPFLPVICGRAKGEGQLVSCCGCPAAGFHVPQFPYPSSSSSMPYLSFGCVCVGGAVEPGLRLAMECMTGNVTTSVFYLKPEAWSHSRSEVASEGHPRKEYSVGGKGGGKKKTGRGSSLGLEPTPKTQRPRGQRGVDEVGMPHIGHRTLWLLPHLRC